MTKATDLADALETALGAITLANGYATDIKGVYGFAKTKKDTAPLPCLLVRLSEDSAEGLSGRSAKRLASYQIEAVLPRTATLQDLQRCHYDILRALGYGQPGADRALVEGAIVDESVEFDPEPESAARTLVCNLALRYVETY